MSQKVRYTARTAAAVCAAAMLAVAFTAPVASADAQATTVWLALEGSHQGQFRGTSTGTQGKQIPAFAFSMSQPYGAATPVVRVTTDAATAPQLLQALVTNELLITPTITFLRPAHDGADSVVYRIKAMHGNIVDATLAIDAHHVPSITFDLLLNGGVTYTTGGSSTLGGWSTGGSTNTTISTQSSTTTAPPPTFSGSVPNSSGVQVIGKFVGQKTGTFPPDPAAARLGGIVLDSLALSMSTPVSNGMAAGRALVRPLVIARPASDDASSFAAAKAADDVFSKIIVTVYQPTPNGNSAASLEIESDQACDVTTPSCGGTSGMAASQPGGSAGLGGQRMSTALATRVPRIAMVSGTAVIQLRPTVIKVTNHSNNTAFTYTP